MQPFLTQIFNLLTTQSDILAYHSVVAFSIAAALPVSLYQWRATGLPQGQRTAAGLGLLLLTRLVLFASSSLAAQNLVGQQSLFQLQPILDRTMALIGLILIAWLWAFPDRARMGDAAAVLLTLLTLVISAVGMVWWAGQSSEMAYNGSWPDLIGEIYALALIAVGVLILVARRPEGWGNGLAMLLLLALGHAGSLVFPLEVKDYQGAVRLAEMIAFPILLTLPQRFLSLSQKVFSGGEAAQSGLFVANPQILNDFLALATEDPAENGMAEVCKLAARRLQADVCLIAAPGEGGEPLKIEGGYDLSQQKAIGQISLGGNLAGIIANAVRRGRPLRMPASSTASDLRLFNQALGVDRPGALLAVPIPGNRDLPPLGIIALALDATRAWTAEDQANLDSLSGILARILHHQWAIARLREEIAQAKIHEHAAQEKCEQIHRENQDLLAQLEKTRQQSLQEHSRAESLAALIASQETAQHLTPQPGGESRLTAPAILGEAQRVKTAQPPQPGGTAATTLPYPSHEQAEVIASIAQEIRQPMSSIIGYTDLLLGESVGILGALQRKFLERVKASTERMGGLLDDLIQTISLGKSELELKPEAVDLSLAIDDAIAVTISQVREKNILLRVDLPDHLPQILADRDAVQQILINLLQNAASVTPGEGEISLSAGVYPGEREDDSQMDYVLLRVTDSGGGIPPEDLPRVFSRLYRADNTLIQGVGDTGVGLSIVKSLVEAHGGRVWVDTVLGRGSTFSILLPVSSGRLHETARKGAPQ